MDFLKSHMPAIKVPKIRKLNACQRITSALQRTFEQLQQQTLRRTQNNPSPGSSAEDRPSHHQSLPTVSGQIVDPVVPKKGNPQKDNFGLYALKCDRSAAKRGLVLNIPRPSKLTASVQRRVSRSPDTPTTPVAMNHEKFEPVQRTTTALQPPPRRKRKSLAGSQDTLNSIPAVPVDETDRGESKERDTDTITTNVKDMCRHFERQESVDIFTRAQQMTQGQFAEFDNIFGASPVPEEEDRGTVVQRLKQRFSSPDVSFGSPAKDAMTVVVREKDVEVEEDLQYFKRTRRVVREDTPVQVKPSKVEKIVFQDQFVPNSFRPPSPPPPPLPTSPPPEETPLSTAVILEADFAKAFPKSGGEKVEEEEKETEVNLVADDGDKKDNHHHHDQLTISRHYLNEDVMVWTF